MANSLVHKTDINYDAENGAQNKITTATEKFVNNTNIFPKAIFPKSYLQKLKTSKDAFLLENIVPTGNTSGKVECDSAFEDLVKRRKQNSLSQRIKESNEWESNNWWLFIIGAVFLTVSLVVFQPHSKRYNAEDNQLKKAKEIITSNNWNVNYNMKVPGPLYIDLREWKMSYENKNTIDSLTHLKDSLTIKANEYGNTIRESAQQKINTLEDKKIAVKKNINDSIYLLAQSIIDKAEDSISKKRSAREYSNAEHKRATAMIRTIDSLATIANAEITKEIAFLKTQVDNKYLPDSTITKQINNIKIPAPISYPYDLLAEDTSTETSGWWSFGFWFLFIIGVILIVIFMVDVIILFKRLPKRESEKIQYFPDTLRTMAFPGKHSAGVSSSHTCNIEFSTMSSESIRLLQSVLVRYKWNVLASHDSFEFNEILMKGEALLYEQKQEAPEPMFFVYEDDFVIVYAGLGEGGSEKGKREVILEPLKEAPKGGEKDRTMGYK